MTPITVLKRVGLSFPALAALLLSGCDVTEPDVEPGADWGYVYAVIESNCSCHQSATGEAGLSMPDMDTAYANLVGVASQELPTMSRVAASDPSNSYLLLKISGTHQDADGSGARMPFGGPYLDDEMIANVRDWIVAGASAEVVVDDDDPSGDDDDATADDDDATADDDDTSVADDDDDTSVADDDDSSAAVDGWTFTQVYAVTSGTCNCHNTSNGSGGQSLGTSAQETYDAWVGVPAVNVSAAVSNINRIEAGDSANSFVMRKLDGTQGANEANRMPLAGGFLDQATLDGIRSWIDAGALNN